MTAPWQALRTERPDWPAGSAGVQDAVDAARAALARLNGPRGVRDRTGRVAAAASMRAARASAALAGAPLGLDPSGAAIGDPVLAGAVRAAAALDGLVGTWRRAPRQVLARLHTLAAADLAAADDLGRPRADPDRPDLVSGRLAALADLVVSSPWPAPVMVAIVHGESGRVGAVRVGGRGRRAGGGEADHGVDGPRPGRLVGARGCTPANAGRVPIRAGRIRRRRRWGRRVGGLRLRGPRPGCGRRGRRGPGVHRGISACSQKFPGRIRIADRIVQIGQFAKL